MPNSSLGVVIPAFDSNTSGIGAQMKAMSSDANPRRTYDRSWEEIEAMLNRAELKRKEWKSWFEECRRNEDRDGMKEAARNHKALDGVVKTLKWTLGEEGVGNPLD